LTEYKKKTVILAGFMFLFAIFADQVLRQVIHAWTCHETLSALVKRKELNEVRNLNICKGMLHAP